MTKAAELAKMGEVLTNSQIGGRRNIVINGAMQVAQRATEVTGIGASAGYFTVDRFDMFFSGTAGRLTQSQVAVTDLPGFANALKLQCTTADTSIASGETAQLQYQIEGQDLQQLKKGTSSAEKTTISFYVKGNAAATYTIEFQDNDNSRHNTQTFAVTTSWNRVSLTFDGDTTGAFDDDNATSVRIQIYLQAGATYTGGTFTSNTWASVTNANTVKSDQTMFFDSTDRNLFITGLQMEVGSQATPFEHRSFGEELALCQRYYFQEIKNQYGALCSGRTFNSKVPHFAYPFPVAMRTLPAVAELGTGGLGVWYVSGSFASVAGATFYQEDSGQTDVQNVSLVFDAVSALTDAAPIMLAAATNDDGIGFDAELQEIHMVTSAKFKKYTLPDGTEVKNTIIAVINGKSWSVPTSSGNSHYQAILEWVAEGNTIEDAD